MPYPRSDVFIEQFAAPCRLPRHAIRTDPSLILQEPNTELYTPSLESLRTLIKTSTSSMTSVPKPLKFLRRFYDELIGVWESWDEKLQDEKVSPCR